MKNISLILIGTVLGVAITFPLTKSFFNNKIVEEETKVLKLDNLILSEMSKGLYGLGIHSNSPPLISVRLSNSNQISEAFIVDRGLNIFSFRDNDLDGKWDRWVYNSKSESYAYENMRGFPDSASVYAEKTVNDFLVRIDEDYFPVQFIDEKAFVEKNGIEIEVEEYGKNLYRIKK